MHIKKSPDSLDIGTAPIIQGTSPQHQATVQSDFDFSKKFTLNLIYRYVSALPEQKVPSYSTGDARFAWKATQQVQLSLVGRNLMQPHHVEFAGDPGPLVGIKRSVYGQITWTR
jgi:iron complex outermembrane receptor protein